MYIIGSILYPLLNTDCKPFNSPKFTPKASLSSNEIIAPSFPLNVCCIVPKLIPSESFNGFVNEKLKEMIKNEN